MKRTILTSVATLMAVAPLFGAGSWGCGGPKRTGINASIAVPFELLTIENYQVEITLFDPATETALQGPVALTQDTDNAIWTGELLDVGEEEITAVVEILGPVDAGDAVLLAQAIHDVTIPKGAPFATITFKPSDFDTNLDADSDGQTNAYEYIHGTDPNQPGGGE